MNDKNELEKNLIKCKMISANCNTLLNGTSYSETYSCLAYVSSNLIHIYSPSEIKTQFSLKGHKQRVNSVKWIDNQKYKVKIYLFLRTS